MFQKWTVFEFTESWSCDDSHAKSLLQKGFTICSQSKFKTEWEFSTWIKNGKMAAKV